MEQTITLLQKFFEVNTMKNEMNGVQELSFMCCCRVVHPLMEIMRRKYYVQFLVILLYFLRSGGAIFQMKRSI